MVLAKGSKKYHSRRRKDMIRREEGTVEHNNRRD